MKVLQHDYRIAELEHALEFSGVDQVISVQSRRSDRENHFLLEEARKSDNLVAGIVGWAPLDSPELRAFLDQYLHEPMLKGVREIISGSSTEKFLNNPDFDQGITELTRHNLAFDLLVSEDQLAAAIAFADRHPNQRIVLNHCGCPQIDPGDIFCIMGTLHSRAGSSATYLLQALRTQWPTRACCQPAYPQPNHQTLFRYRLSCLRPTKNDVRLRLASLQSRHHLPRLAQHRGRSDHLSQ